MNRKNFLGHLALALTLILLAAVAGQIRRWRHEARFFYTPHERLELRQNSMPMRADSSLERKGGEVLVRFREGTPLELIKKLAAKFHDKLEDNYENINGLVALED